MHAVAASVVMYLAWLPLFGQERPDPANDEWLLGLTTGIEVVDHATAAKLIPKFPKSVTQEKGLFVSRVRPFSPADDAGVQVGDLVSKISGKDVNTPEEFKAAIDRAKPATSVAITLNPASEGPKSLEWKGRKTLQLRVTRNGIIARISVTVKPDKEIGLGLPMARDHKRVPKSGPMSLLFAVDDEGFATNAYFQVMHQGKERVSPTEITIVADDHMHTLPVQKEGTTESVGKSGLLYDQFVWSIDDEKAEAAFRDCIAAKNVTVRFNGKSPAERTLTEAERNFLQVTFEAYKSLRYGDVFKIGNQ